MWTYPDFKKVSGEKNICLQELFCEFEEKIILQERQRKAKELIDG